jgi:pyruvate,orthophosphate dikinase
MHTAMQKNKLAERTRCRAAVAPRGLTFQARECTSAAVARFDLSGARMHKRRPMPLWYAFSKDRTDGDRSMFELLGGKGANLAEMARLGIRVPPGFTLPTTVGARCRDGIDDSVREALREGIAHIERALGGPRFGDPERPLLLSVRSGARVSMPGMMDTVLNVGLNGDSLGGLARAASDRRFALDSYRRLIQMFGDVVAGVARAQLEAPVTAAKERRGVSADAELSADELESVILHLLGAYRAHTGAAFPQDPSAQLEQAVAAVFASWNTARAATYRRLHHIPDDWGTAATVQAMVFGNFGARSGTGVAFTRDPSSGQRRVLGEWLQNAQGEDIVAGTRTPAPILGAARGTLQTVLPETMAELGGLMQVLEAHYADMQDIEFTIEDGVLFLLQTRRGKRTAAAAVQIACDLVREGSIDERTAVSRVTPEQVGQLLHPQLDEEAPKTQIAMGLPASPGAASGAIVFDAAAAERRALHGTDVILVRRETSPEDVGGMHAARGILTATGGMTSHAAVVARGMGRPCVSACQGLHVDAAARVLRVAGRTLREGDAITLDGATGAVYLGIVPTVAPRHSGDFSTLLGWADAIRARRVRANADTAEDARAAVALGAEGIGLCRTEHMFFAGERIVAVQQMILAPTLEARETALAKLFPMQREDFVAILRVMGERPVTIRLLDPPLHEFLPHSGADVARLAASVGVDEGHVLAKVAELREQNPMLGHRGCRLGLTYPEVYAMQTRAVVEAMCDLVAAGAAPQVEIMVPLIASAEELVACRAQVEAVAETVFAARGVRVHLHIGTMIELPRAALLADEIAAHADFFSFGTNDLTQTTLGLSRDDAGRFLPTYLARGFLASDPFASLDQAGVGKLVSMAARLGRGVKPGLKLGVCGEHGGDPASIAFFADQGLDYVSCSPYRLPVARMALAHHALRRTSPATNEPCDE